MRALFRGNPKVLYLLTLALFHDDPIILSCRVGIRTGCRKTGTDSSFIRRAVPQRGAYEKFVT